jgi:N-acetylglucosamine-6-phosphate deacetylase
MTKVFSNGIIFTGHSVLHTHSLIVENGQVKEIVPGTPTDRGTVIDLKGKLIIPGLIDLQVNGGGGAFFTKDPSEETIKRMYYAHLEYGTTGFLPTVISTSLENILNCIEVTRQCMKEQKYGVLGMHLEGPFFNPIKKGAHAEKYIRKPTDEILRTIINKGEGVIKLITLAPELFTGKQINMLVEAGFKVSAGHSNCLYPEAVNGFNQGITKVTHLYNAMSQFTGRDPGLVGAFLDNEKIYGGIIVDGFHCDYASVRIAFNLKKGKLFLVSDASFVKHPVESFEFDGFKIHYRDGKYLTESGNLAGSSISMLEALQNCVRHADIKLEDAVKMSSAIPAEYMGIDQFVGKIKKGCVADFVVLSTDLELESVYVKGESIQILV